MELTDIRSGLLVADGRALLKISNVYRDAPDNAEVTSVTAQVLLASDGKTPERTTVLRFNPGHVTALKEPSDRLVHKYEVAYGLPATTP